MAIALTLAIASAACDRSHAATADPAPPPPEVVVHTVRPTAVTLTTELPGRTAPYGIAELRPQVSGIIQRRLFVEGATVTAGAPLYQIDPARYEAALDRARAALAESQANLTAARLRAERYRGLVAINAVSKTGLRRCRSRPATGGGEHRRERGGCPHSADRSPATRS
jgi:membrane fusion protein (multidrug efflux system)